MDWITTLCNKFCSTLETWPRHHFNIHPALYKTTMTQAYTRIRILGDETNNSALQPKLDREKNWLRKISITDYAEKKCFNKPH